MAVTKTNIISYIEKCLRSSAIDTPDARLVVAIITDAFKGAMRNGGLHEPEAVHYLNGSEALRIHCSLIGIEHEWVTDMKKRLDKHGLIGSIRKRNEVIRLEHPNAARS